MAPVQAAKADWMVLRKIEYVKRECSGPYAVVVIRSWRYAQLRLFSTSAHPCCNPYIPRSLFPP